MNSDGQNIEKTQTTKINNEPDHSMFDRLRLYNPIVERIVRMGGTAKDCVVALSIQNSQLGDRIMELEGIAPRRTKDPDGKVWVWRCPVDLIPETDLSYMKQGMQNNE